MPGVGILMTQSNSYGEKERREGTETRREGAPVRRTGWEEEGGRAGERKWKGENLG